MFRDSKNIVIENWIKPPKLVQYQNARLLSYENNVLICNFLFPLKYSNNPFYINGEKILDEKDMFWGKRYFYADRFYSLLEYYSYDDKIMAYYIDISLPPFIEKDRIFITDLKIDFWIMADKKKYIILDEDELTDAMNEKLFNQKELDSCFETTDFIKKKLDHNNFEGIFIDYKTSDYKEWDRYKEHMKDNL